MFADEQQEQNFVVKGGLLWFHHVLVAAVDISKSYQVCFALAIFGLRVNYAIRFDYTLVTWNWRVKIFCIANCFQHLS